MNQKTKMTLIGVLLVGVFLVLLLMVFTGGAGLGLSKFFGGQTVVSVSRIQYDNGASRWVALDALTGNDYFYFYKGDLTEATGGKVSARSSVNVLLTPQQPYCTYNLVLVPQPVGGVFGLGTRQFYYYRPSNPAPSFPYSIQITKTLASDQTVSYPQSYTITPGINATTLNFAAPDGGPGALTLNSFGATTVSATCPTLSDFALIQNKDGTWRVVDWTQYNLAINRIQNDWTTLWTQISPLSPNLAPGNAAWNLLNDNYFSQVSTPPDWQNCAINPAGLAGLSCYASISANNGTIIHSMPMGSSVNLALLSMDTKFADGVMVAALNGIPQIQPFTVADQVQGGTGTFTITVNNVGTSSDTFNIRADSPDGLTTFNTLSQNTGTVAQASAGTATFSYYSVQPGTAKVCVYAASVGSGATGNSPVCASYTGKINPTLVPSTPGGTVAVSTQGVASVPTGNVTAVSCPTGYLFSSANNSCYIPATAPLKFDILGGAPTCPDAYLLDQKTNTCIPPSKGTLPTTCYQKATAIQCGGLDISCQVNQVVQQVGCTVNDIIAGILALSIIAFIGILFIIAMMFFLLKKRR